MHPALDSTAISSNTPPTTESHKLNLRVPQTSASMLSISSMSPAISDTQMTAEVMMNALPPPPPIVSVDIGVGVEVGARGRM
jgi:hypothetical protein